VLTGKGEPLAIANSLSESHTMIIALLVGSALVWGLYRWSARQGEQIGA